MLRELIEKEATVVKNAVQAMREWLHASRLPKPPASREAPPARPMSGSAERGAEPPKPAP